MEFNITVNLAGLDEDYNIDEEIENQIMEGVKEQLLSKGTDRIIKKLDAEIDAKLYDASKVIKERVDDFIKTVTAERIESIMMPEKSSEWSSEVKYIPISEFIGNRFEELATKKYFNRWFEKADYEGDAEYSLVDKDIHEYLESNYAIEISTAVRKLKEEANRSLTSVVYDTLKESMPASSLEKLRVHQMVEEWQEKHGFFAEKNEEDEA